MWNLAKIGVLLVGLVPLAGCDTLQRITNTYGAITDSSVPPSLVIVAGNTFDGIEVTAKNIIVACTPKTRPSACKDVPLRNLIAAIRAGRASRDGLEGFLAAHPSALGSKGLYDALEASISTIQAAIAAYNGA